MRPAHSCPLDKVRMLAKETYLEQTDLDLIEVRVATHAVQ